MLYCPTHQIKDGNIECRSGHDRSSVIIFFIVQTPPAASTSFLIILVIVIRNGRVVPTIVIRNASRNGISHSLEMEFGQVNISRSEKKSLYKMNILGLFIS
jgi:hypothetical protein